jgi:hypothetical protein
MEAIPPSDIRTQMLASTKQKYDAQQLRVTEAQAKCDRLMGVKPAVAAPAPPPAAVEAAAPAVAAPAVVATPAVVGTPAAPCLTGCGKDTDCKGERICAKGECVDPPAKRSPPP